MEEADTPERCMEQRAFPRSLSELPDTLIVQQCQSALTKQVCKVSAVAVSMNTLCTTFLPPTKGENEVSGSSMHHLPFASSWPETQSYFGMSPLTKSPPLLETFCLSQCLGSLPAPFFFISRS